MLNNDGLKNWIKEYLPGQLLGDDIDLAVVSGDAGFRKYFRINSRPPMVATYAPPQQENNIGFVRIGLALSRAGVHTPRVYAVDYKHGYLLQEDLGAELYQDSLTAQTAEGLYERAEAVLLKIQQVPADTHVFPEYCVDRLRDEMALFCQWFVVELLGHPLTIAEQQMLERLFDVLVNNALEQPQVVVHRDFHSRNLMLLPNHDVGVIDFQDAVIGPSTYDLVSLLRDCYVHWPQSLVNQRMCRFLHKAKEAGLAAEDVTEQQYERWFDLMGLQRHIKVLGIFARLCLRDGKSGYLADLPLVIRYTLEVAQRYADTQDFYQWFTSVLLEISAQQDWYQDWHTAGEA